MELWPPRDRATAAGKDEMRRPERGTGRGSCCSGAPTRAQQPTLEAMNDAFKLEKEAMEGDMFAGINPFNAFR